MKEAKISKRADRFFKVTAKKIEIRKVQSEVIIISKLDARELANQSLFKRNNSHGIALTSQKKIE
jgi:hypothetical protein